MEMTGLNLRKDRIMEIACLITDNKLNVVAEQASIIIHQPDSLLNDMNEWCTRTHKEVSELNVRLLKRFEIILPISNRQAYLRNVSNLL